MIINDFESDEALITFGTSSSLTIKVYSSGQITEVIRVLILEVLVLAPWRLNALTEAIFIEVGTVFAEDAFLLSWVKVINSETIFIIILNTSVVAYSLD